MVRTFEAAVAGSRCAISLTSSSHKANPFPFYDDLRHNNPVAPIQIGTGQRIWLITRYDDSVNAFKDHRLIKNRFSIVDKKQPWVPPFLRPLMRNMLDVDGCDHTRLRSLASQAFTPNHVGRMTGRIHELCDQRARVCVKMKSFDLISDYALPIPATIIAEMLGAPAGDTAKFTSLSTAIVSADTSKWKMMLALPSVLKIIRYIRRLIRAKKRSPGDDLLTDLINAEEAGERLDEGELFAMVFLLLIAGFETTVNLIGNSFVELLQHSDLLDQLKEDEDLDHTAIEEFLRFCGPLELATERFAATNLIIADTEIPQGDQVHIAICSANRDESQFDSPNELQLERTPNQHLGFGLGSHYCLGAPLARLEAEIAIRTLLNACQTLRSIRDPRQLSWRPGLVIRGLSSLPVTMTSAS